MAGPGLTRRRVLATLPGLAACTLRPEQQSPPPLPREFRAAWVATVDHIDWPSRAGLGRDAQREEMNVLLDRAAATGLNALVLQVRPSADAIYPSALEPWSEFLTGADGRAPDQPWDPLAEWVAGAHEHGMELHAWFSPFRARHALARSEPSAQHVSRTDPALVRRYGESLWLDPGEPRAVQRLQAVVLDVLQRYDIDGVLLDDHFYPYPVSDLRGQELPFPDDGAWQRHLDAGGRPDRAAWRRDNVDRLIQALQPAIHAAKPWVRFGVSPFGLPRPARRPPGITGFSPYDKLYADVDRWLQAGWVDYLAPQLYWPIEPPAQSFPVLLQSWRAANPLGRHVWPGLFTSRLGARSDPYDAAELLAQIALTRQPGTVDNGHLHYSMTALLANRDGIADRLRDGPYDRPALTPATPWLAEAAPAPPAFDLIAAGGGTRLQPRQGPGPPLRQAVLWQRRADQWRWQALPLPTRRAFELQPTDGTALLLGIGRSGLESAPLAVSPP